MSAEEKKNTLLVINLDNLIVGDKLYFNSGQSTPSSVRKLTRDRALALARTHGVYAATNPCGNPDYPKGTGCCNDGKCLIKQAFRYCTSRRRTGRWAKGWLSAAR